MKKLILLVAILIHSQSALATLTVVDRHKLASVTLHTELIEASKRVYLAADFEAKHDKGMIGCELKIEHKNGQPSGPTYYLDESTTLMPKEVIPFNLGLFPERFHASGLDVKAELVCRRVTFFDNLRSRPKPRLLKASEPRTQVCCRTSPISLNCATEPEGGVEVVGTITQLTVAKKVPNDYPSCWPEEDEKP